MLRQLTTQLQRIITFYKYVESQLDAPPECDTTTVDDATSAKNLSSILLTSEREINRVTKLAKMLNNFMDGNVSAETKVKFKDENVFFDFLSCFELGTSRLIGLRKDIKEESVHQICKFALCSCKYAIIKILYIFIKKKMRFNVTFSTTDISRTEVFRRYEREMAASG